MKTVLITGSSGGIGRATAIKFAQMGYNIVLHYNKSLKKMDELDKEIEKYNVGSLMMQADIRDEEHVKDLIEAGILAFGKIDVVVNNAGVGLAKLIQDSTLDDISNVVATNMLGPIFVAKHIAPKMISQKSGKIINISSVWGKVGGSMESVYSATKGAMIAFTYALSKELAPSNITVNCVCPGVIDTEMLKNYTKEEKRALAESTPLGRLGTPEDVANAIYFLASEEANFITGDVITVDGGFSL